MEVVTERAPTEQEWGDLLFAWRVCKHVQVQRDRARPRPGDGRHRRRPDEPRRLGPARRREGADWTSLEGAALASDAFFPFADGPELAIEAGVTAIIQPGGSMRDDEVVAAADEAGVAMVFTGRRHFRH